MWQFPREVTCKIQRTHLSKEWTWQTPMEDMRATNAYKERQTMAHGSLRQRSRRYLWAASLCALLLTTIACTMPTVTPTARTDAPISSPTNGPLPDGPTVPPAPTAPAGGLVVTVFATDVALWNRPDNLSGNVAVSFTINGNPVQTAIYVSGELPVLDANILGTDGKTRWTHVRYSGHAGPQDTGTSFDVTGYVRNDLVSAPHAPGAPAVRNP